jgi:predicted alpha/beta hydrolase family esterase
MTIYLFLEDFDNPELEDWEEQMEDAVRAYNEEYGTSHLPKTIVKNYKSWRREKAYDY